MGTVTRELTVSVAGSAGSQLRPARILTAIGAAAAPDTIPRSLFCRTRNIASEAEYKQGCRVSGRITYHMHLGLNTWTATRDALHEIVQSLSVMGYDVDRYGLCLDRSMSLKEALRDDSRKETGPRLATHQWAEIAEIEPVQPHLGDFMIGTPASLENTLHALNAGVTTIGNIGQYFAFDTPGGHDDIAATEATVMALGAMAAHRTNGTLVHSYLDDGPAMQLSHYGAYVGWAALELYIVETLLGARLAHCFGGLVTEPATRAILSFALDDIHGREGVGSMVYGNTVDYTQNRLRNQAVLSTYLLVDIAGQLRRPTGHAVNPVPLTEAERIPSAADIIEVQLIAREIEREARRSGDLFDWARLESIGAEVAGYGRRFADRILLLLEERGVDVTDAGQLLLALRRSDPGELEAAARVTASPTIRRLEPWKAGRVRSAAAGIEAAAPSLAGIRIVLAVLEVHDVIRDALATALPRLGCEVILLSAGATPAGIAHAAVQEDAHAIVVGTYNGSALTIGRELCAASDGTGFDGAIFFGGLLNEDVGDPLPVDVRPQLESMGIHCVARAEDLAPLLASHVRYTGDI